MSDPYLSMDVRRHLESALEKQAQDLPYVLRSLLDIHHLGLPGTPPREFYPPQISISRLWWGALPARSRISAAVWPLTPRSASPSRTRACGLNLPIFPLRCAARATQLLACVH